MTKPPPRKRRRRRNRPDALPPTPAAFRPQTFLLEQAARNGHRPPTLRELERIEQNRPDLDLQPTDDEGAPQ